MEFFLFNINNSIFVFFLSLAEYPVYHSLYDDFIWMQKFGDPMFKRHVAGHYHSLRLRLRLLLYLKEMINGC